MNQYNYGKSVKITAPEGYEIDTINSTPDEIVFKKVKLANLYPMSVRDIPCRKHYITTNGDVNITTRSNDINQLSTASRARAFLALMQLVELRDAWQKVDNKFIDYSSYFNKFTILNGVDGIVKGITLHIPRVLAFSLRATRDKFAETFKDLIEEAKELL